MNLRTKKIVDAVIRVYGLSREEIMEEALKEKVFDADGNVSISGVSFSAHFFYLHP